MKGYNKFPNLKTLFSEIKSESGNILSLVIEYLKRKDYEEIAHRTNYLLLCLIMVKLPVTQGVILQSLYQC